MISRQEQPPACHIIEREREHPIQRAKRCRAALFVKMQNDFSVCFGIKVVALWIEGVLQLEIIVDFAIESDPHRAVLVGHRLPPAWRKINDAQATMAEIK